MAAAPRIRPAQGTLGILTPGMGAVATTFYARRYLLKHLGGYTGDCLGATQQVAEIAVYLGLCWSI